MKGTNICLSLGEKRVLQLQEYRVYAVFMGVFREGKARVLAISSKKIFFVKANNFSRDSGLPLEES